MGGGLFFHINRAFQGTEWEMPSRGVFVLMFTFSRCYLWPMYIRNLYQEALSKNTNYHLVGAILETGLFLTNLHFLYKNIAPIWQSGRLMHRKPLLSQGVAGQAPLVEESRQSRCSRG